MAQRKCLWSVQKYTQGSVIARQRSPLWYGFYTRLDCVVFVVDRVAMGQGFPQYFGFPNQFSFHPLQHWPCAVSILAPPLDVKIKTILKKFAFVEAVLCT